MVTFYSTQSNHCYNSCLVIMSFVKNMCTTVCHHCSLFSSVLAVEVFYSYRYPQESSKVKLLSPGFVFFRSWFQIWTATPVSHAHFLQNARPVDYHLANGICALSKISWRGALLLRRERLNTYGKT